MRIRALITLGFSFVAFQALAQDRDAVPFSDQDTLADIRAKIELNRYDFTVATNWVFNKSPAEKAAFFSRHSSRSLDVVKSPAEMGPLATRQIQSLPSSFCWTNYGGHSYIGPVRNQGDCGSCYSFGACASAEGVYNKAMGRYDASCADFSESFIAWCLGRLSQYNDNFFGCDGADYSYQELQALTVEGVCTEAAFPYRETDPGSCTHMGDPRTVFSGWYRVDCNDIEGIKAAIYTYGVVDAAVKVTSAWEAYSSGIYQDTNTNCPSCENTTSDHAIALVGWNDNGGNGYWILRNSWGAADWGEGGYMRIKYKAAGVACAVAYLVYSNSGSPVTPPTVTTDSASLISTNAAVLRGTVNPQGASSWHWFEYGLTTNYGSFSVKTNTGSGSSAVSVSNRISGLVAETTYHFRIVATNTGGKSAGADRSFVTAAIPPAAPVVITDPASDITNTAATLRGRVNPNGYSSVYFFEYGFTTSYGQTTTAASAGSGTASISVSNRPTGLTPGATYHFRVVATNSGGRSNGIDRTFVTVSSSSSHAPWAVTDPATCITNTAATVNGSVNPNGYTTAYAFEYGLSESYGQTTTVASAGSGTSLIPVTNRLSGLTSGATYHFRVVATNSGGRSNGIDRTFSTLSTNQGLVFYEGFENGGAIPSGWVDEVVNGVNYWEFMDGNGYTSHPAHAYAGSYSALYFWTNGVNRLVSPAINFGSKTNNASLSFWHYMENWFGDMDQLKIYYRTSAGGAWNFLAEYTNDTASWTQRTLPLPSPNSTYYLAFVATSRWGYGVCLDEIRVTGEEGGVSALAPAVTTALASVIGSSSATLNGTVIPNGAATLYWFEYGTNTAYGSSSSRQSAGSGWSGVGVSWAASGLATQRLYHFRLAASNSVGKTYGADQSFTTLAAESSTIFSENFEHGGVLPSGWMQEYVSESRHWEATTGSSENQPATAHGGTYNALFEGQSGVTRLVTPVIDFGSNTNQATLAFWLYMKDWYRDQDELRVYYKTSSGGSWTLIGTYDTRVATWTKRMLSLPQPCNTYYLAFEGTALWGYGICIDDMEICGRTVPWFPSFDPMPVPAASTNFIVQWASITDRIYAVHRSTNLMTGFVSLITNLPATPPMNTYTDKTQIGACRFYRVEEKLP
ncbi:MAG: C1 family peptidase [Lentisphaerota bacterium]